MQCRLRSLWVVFFLFIGGDAAGSVSANLPIPNDPRWRRAGDTDVQASRSVLKEHVSAGSFDPEDLGRARYNVWKQYEKLSFSESPDLPDDCPVWARQITNQMQNQNQMMQAMHSQMQAMQSQMQSQMQTMQSQMQDVSRQTTKAMNRNAISPSDPIEFPPRPAGAPAHPPCVLPETLRDFQDLTYGSAQQLCAWYNIIPLPPRSEQSKVALARLLGLRSGD
mmetsp:Transcript_39296/g.92655  ORF Transcript_39296/g.92655 Transcript_39296/m.92655 type:complete len:222 (-) Transcript_39296:677-1342(-)